MNISSTASSAASGRWIRRLAAAGAAVAVLVAPGRAGAQDPNLIDQGRYDIRLGDRATGTETFAIRRQGEGYMAVGRIQLEGSGTWLRSAELGLRTDGSFAPVRYEIRALGGPHSLIAARTGTRVRITTSSEEGDRMTELLANPNHVLLGPGIAQHYYFLIQRLESGRGGGVIALVPGEGREAPVRVVGTSESTVEIGGEPVPARRWELSIDGTTHLVWADPADGRILRVEIPDRGWRSVRQAEQ